MADEDEQAEELLSQMVHESDENGSESADQGQDGQEDQTGTQDGSEGQEEPDENSETFPRKYVENLRKESKGYRERAKRGEVALSRLTELSIKDATKGILIDPTDLEFDEKTMTDDEGFPDTEKIKAAAEELVSKKPHLAPRRPRGDIGQGKRTKEDDFSLAGILRNNAG